MLVDWTVNLSGVIEVVGMAGTGLLVAGSMRTSLKGLREQVLALQLDIRKLNDILTTLAVQDQRITTLATQVDELRHGIGWVDPPPRAARRK